MEKEVGRGACTRKKITQDVSVLSQSCLGLVSEMFRCFGDVSMMFWWCLSDITLIFGATLVMSRSCFGDGLLMSRRCLNDISVVS